MAPTFDQLFEQYKAPLVTPVDSTPAQIMQAQAHKLALIQSQLLCMDWNTEPRCAYLSTNVSRCLRVLEDDALVLNINLFPDSIKEG